MRISRGVIGHSARFHAKINGTPMPSDVKAAISLQRRVTARTLATIRTNGGRALAKNSKRPVLPVKSKARSTADERRALEAKQQRLKASATKHQSVSEAREELEARNAKNGIVGRRLLAVTGVNISR
jgi:hypothetical protein